MADRREIVQLQDLIKDSIGGEVVEQIVESLLPPGENYGSEMYKVDFKVKKDGKVEEYHAVAKCTPQNPVTQEFFNTQVTFKSEIGWYTTVIPTLVQFQRDHGVEKVIDFFQTFYGARISLDPTSDKVDLDGVIVTQNLKYLGYGNVDRHVGFDELTSYTILRDLATFHAVFLALKLQKPELLEKKVKPYLTRAGEVDEELQAGFNKPIFAVFDQIPEIQPNIDRIKKAVNDSNVFGERPLREPWVTVIHMDFWMNNIMVTGGKDSKTMFLDFQLPNFGTPVADLIFFLFTSVQLDVIREKLDDFIEFYHEQFTKNLRELDVSTDNYSFEGLLKEIATEVKVGEFGHVLDHSHFIFCEKGKTNFDQSNKDFTKEDLIVQEDIEVNDKHIAKYSWIISEVLKRNWI